MANMLTDVDIESSVVFPQPITKFDDDLIRVLTNYFNKLYSGSGAPIDYIDFTDTYSGEHVERRLHWSADDQTLELGMEGSEVKLQLGQELYIRAKNECGCDISNGQLVVISGSSGQRIAVALADKDTVAQDSVIAMATEDITKNNNGYFTVFGLVRDVDTSGVGEGDGLYLGDNGAFQSALPTGVDVVWSVGVCVVSNASAGVVFVAPSLVTAIKWDDLRVEPSVKGTGSNNPTFTKFFDNGSGSRGVYLYAFTDETSSNEREVFFAMQMPHNWKLGTDLHLHVHWVGNLSDTDATPIWGLEYNFKDIGQVFGNTSIVYSSPGNISGDGSSDSDITAGKHYMSVFNAITPDSTNDGMSAILIGRLFRNSSNASDTYNVASNACGLLYIDCHYQVDSHGSKTIYTK